MKCELLHLIRLWPHILHPIALLSQASYALSFVSILEAICQGRNCLKFGMLMYPDKLCKSLFSGYVSNLGAISSDTCDIWIWCHCLGNTLKNWSQSWRHIVFWPSSELIRFWPNSAALPNFGAILLCEAEPIWGFIFLRKYIKEKGNASVKGNKRHI